MPRKRRFELVAGTSRKFWEIAQTGSAFTTRYGRIGSEGQETTKRFPGAAAAGKAYEQIVAAKVREGYHEVTKAPAARKGARPVRLMKLDRTIADCTDNHGVQKEGDEWGHNILSSKTVRGPSGKLGLAGEVDAAPDPAELKLCVRLAAAAGRIMGDLALGMGSSGEEQCDRFFVAKHVGFQCRSLDPWGIRPAFGGALYPAAKIKVFPLAENTSWWKTLVKDLRQREHPDEDPYNSNTMRDALGRWRKLFAWFKAEKAFVESGFVFVDKSKTDYLRGGVVFPRLLVGRTRGGSIAGLFGAFVDA
jgi:predicted DNA-binding WGR domain protein